MTNLIVETKALDLLERLSGETAGLVFLHLRYDTGGLGPLAFDPQAGAHDLGEHLEDVSRFLQQSRRILTEAGTLFLRTDALIAAHHQLLANRVFGAERFAAKIIVPSIHEPSPDQVWPDYEVFLAYTRSESSVLHVPTRPWTEEEARERFGYSDERGPYRRRSLTRPAGWGGFNHVWKGVPPPPDHEWRYRADVMDQLYAEGRIELNPGRGTAYLKLYLAEAPETPVGSIWEDIRHALLHEREPWPEMIGPILDLVRFPVALLERIIGMASNPGDMVVAPWDAAGSVALAASRLGRRWTIGVNARSFTPAVAGRLARHGYGREADLQIVNFDDLDDRLPPVSRSYHEDHIRGLAPEPPPAFVLGEPVTFEESLHVEFKEVQRANPIGAIKEAVDKYAVGFLNREGGRILWGIRDRDHIVVGVRLDAPARDEVRKLVVDKLAQIRPAPPPTGYDIELHPVLDRKGTERDLWIVELRLGRGDPGEVYCSSGGTHWIKTASGLKQLAGPELIAEVKRRVNL